jgi:3-hydroxyisobutyrate dehydrogenase
MGSAEKIFHAGPAGAGQVAKAANNMLLAVHMIGTSEALAMGAAHGLDPAVLSEIMKASSGNNWSLQVYNPWPGVMAGVPSSNSYQPGFMVDLMVKDLGLACEVAESCGLNNQMGKQAMAAYSDHQGEGNGLRDFSSILEWVKAQ